MWRHGDFKILERKRYRQLTRLFSSLAKSSLGTRVPTTKVHGYWTEPCISSRLWWHCRPNVHNLTKAEYSKLTDCHHRTNGNPKTDKRSSQELNLGLLNVSQMLLPTEPVLVLDILLGMGWVSGRFFNRHWLCLTTTVEKADTGTLGQWRQLGILLYEKAAVIWT